jgi:hypothetical protein
MLACMNATSCPPEAATSCSLFSRGGIYTRALECPAFATVWAAAASASKEDGHCWSLAMVEELMGRERFLVELKACVEQETNGHRFRRPVSMLRRDLPLAPFCFNAGLLLSPERMSLPGCSFPWDADTAGGQLGEIVPCNASHAARGTGIAAQRAHVHREQCDTGQKFLAYLRARRGCCFSSIEPALQQQVEFAQLQRESSATCGHRAAIGSSGSSGSGGAGVDGGGGGANSSRQAATVAACCQRWTDSLWHHNEVHVSWNAADVVGVYFVRPTDAPHAQAMAAMISAARMRRPPSHGDVASSSLGLARARPVVETVHICGDRVPGRIMRTTPTKRARRAWDANNISTQAQKDELRKTTLPHG